MADPQIRAIVQGMELLTERIVVKITLDVVANLIETTPVDTGWARANWVPAIGAPFKEDLSRVRPDAASAGQASGKQQAAVGAMASYKLVRGSVFVSNNVPYINRLNAGSSQQAPAAFVQRAIEKAVTRDILGLAT